MVMAPEKKIDVAVRQATCPACGCYVAVPFLGKSWQPLATIAWPESAESARSMPRLLNDFVRCIDCGHIYNMAFNYEDVPYSDKPNLMFNRGALWSGFLNDIRARMLRHLPAQPVVVEIGHGDGSFLAALAESCPAGTFIGFDPNGATAGHHLAHFRAEYFDPIVHIPELQPDLIISRHVLEHLTNPLGFLQRLSFVSVLIGRPTLTYFEVPCVDRVLDTARTVDFYYEHNSHFTTRSFTRMLSRCPAQIIDIGHGYDGEVVFGFMELSGTAEQMETTWEAMRYFQATYESRQTISAQLDELHRSGRTVAIWGGTGKSAAFMIRYGCDSERFPLVVDSDIVKVGTFVPGTGQEIRFRDWLIDHPADVIIIPPQWRARDILAEMQRANLPVTTLLIEHDGRLVDFMREEHPYK